MIDNVLTLYKEEGRTLSTNHHDYSGSAGQRIQCDDNIIDLGAIQLESDQLNDRDVFDQFLFKKTSYERMLDPANLAAF